VNSAIAGRITMDRRDIYVAPEDYREIIKWARLRNSKLAEIIENKIDIITHGLTNKAYYRIRKDDINENDAIDLLHMFFDNEQYSNKEEDCIYFGHLAEVSRPVAEGPLI
jgi:hypothetical protein